MCDKETAMSNFVEKIEEFLESDEGKIFIENENLKKKLLLSRFDKFENYLKTHDFDKLIYRVILEHNEDWFETCRINGLEPYPNNKLNFILEYLDHKLEPIEDNVYEMECDFPHMTYEYKGYYFQVIFGQGSIIRIYNKNDNRLLLQV